ncbi:hypothetical protein ACVNF4_35075, partial [Streptomyces sp. S6]
DDATGGPLSALAVVVPALSAGAAAVFAMLGFGLRTAGAGSRLSEALLLAALVATGAAVVSALAGFGWLLVTALRDRSTSDEANLAVARARAVWEQALLDRGILPYLRTALAADGMAGAPSPRAERGFGSPELPDSAG